jgi:hypothetical protein
LINIDYFLEVFLLRLIEFHTDDSHIQINRENGSNENKNNENISHPGLILKHRSGLLRAAINNMIHIIWPALQGGQNKETDETLVYVLEINIVVVPFPAVGRDAGGAVDGVEGLAVRQVVAETGPAFE